MTTIEAVKALQDAGFDLTQGIRVCKTCGEPYQRARVAGRPTGMCPSCETAATEAATAKLAARLATIQAQIAKQAQGQGSTQGQGPQAQGEQAQAVTAEVASATAP